MVYCGLDISGKSFEVYAQTEKKKVIEKAAYEPSKRGLRQLAAKLGNGRKLFVLEAGNQMKWIADTLKTIPGAEVHVVHPNKIKWIYEASGKTDKIDAKKLSELARIDALPRAVRVVEGKTRKMRELASARHLLQSKRVALINSLRGMCRQEGMKLPEKFFTRQDWREVLKKSKFSDTLKLIIEGYMLAIDGLLDGEAQVTGELCAVDDERVKLAETVPAIGKISSRVLVAAIDEAKRFDNSKCVAKYGSLTPSLYQSGDVTRLGRISPDGRGEIRRMLLQCAHAIKRTKTAEAKPLREFYERVAKRAGTKRATVALARKLLTTVYGVLKSGKEYDPAKLSRKAA